MKRDISRKPAIVYQAVNRINGKRYIGVTTQSLAGRRSGHKGRSARSDTPTVFDLAIRRYGIEAFEFSILTRFDNRLEAAAEEIRLISETKPEYNISRGGDGIMPPSEEQFAFFAAGREKAKERRKRPVICLSDGKIFSSSAEAADHYGTTRSALCVHLKGQRAMVAGRFFSYYTGPEKPFDDPARALQDLRAEQRRKFLIGQANKSPVKNWNRASQKKAIVCITDGREFDSIRAAADFYRIPGKRISEVAHQRPHKLTVKGRIFVFKGQEHRPRLTDRRWTDKDLLEKRKEGFGRWLHEKHMRSVKCLNDGMVYESIKSASLHYRIGPMVVRYSAERNGCLRWSKHNLGFAFVGKR